MRFVTPLRIKVRHQLTDRATVPGSRVPHAAPDAGDGTLARAQCGGGLGFQSLLQRSKGVRVAGAALGWLDWERWSQHQSAAMKLGSLVGTLTLEGRGPRAFRSSAPHHQDPPRRQGGPSSASPRSRCPKRLRDGKAEKGPQGTAGTTGT